MAAVLQRSNGEDHMEMMRSHVSWKCGWVLAADSENLSLPGSSSSTTAKEQLCLSADRRQASGRVCVPVHVGGMAVHSTG
jgi:hypothetical protein